MDDPIPPTALLEAPRQYKDDDLVYVDPEARTVVGLVEWQANGKPKSLQRVEPVHEEEAEEPAAAAAPVKGKGKAPPRGRSGRKMRIRFYPWGTYRAMKRLFKIEGKVPEVRGNATLDEVLPKALSEPFWD